jgi:hypothetical protein
MVFWNYDSKPTYRLFNDKRKTDVCESTNHQGHDALKDSRLKSPFAPWEFTPQSAHFPPYGEFKSEVLISKSERHPNNDTNKKPVMVFDRFRFSYFVLRIYRRLSARRLVGETIINSDD